MLEPYLKPVLSKHRSLALAIWGEAGIGKSYQLSSLLSTLPCKCLSVHATTPLAQLIDKLEKPKKLALWAEITLGKVAQGEQVEVKNLITALSASLAGLAPFVLHLEDLHEADPERLELIKDLAKSVKRSKGIGLMCSSRTEPPDTFIAVQLRPLSRQDSDTLLETELQTSLPKSGLEFIYNKAAGNPLFSLEYLRYLTRQGNFWSDGQNWHWREAETSFVPSTIEALIELSLNAIAKDETLETLVASKALLPLEPSELVCAVSGLSPSELKSASERLKKQGIFLADGFAHPLYRELSLQRIPLLKRQTLARRALEASRLDPLKAASFLEDAHLSSAEALGLLKQAVKQSKANKNELQTGKLLAQMLELLPQKEQARVALEAAHCLKYSAISEAIRLAKRAADIDKAIASEASLLEAELLAIQGYLPEAESLWQSLEASLDQKAYVVGLVRLRGTAHHYRKVVDTYGQYPECFSQPDAATTQWLVRSLAHLGQLELAETLLARVKTSTVEDKILALKAASDIAYSKSDFSAMERLEAEIYQQAKSLGNLRVMDQALFNRALALEGLGLYQERKTSLEEAMHVCQELGDVSAYMIAQRAYGSLLAELGDYERAEECLQAARRYLESIDFFTYLLDCETSLSQFYRESLVTYGNILSLKHARAALACAKRMDNPINVADALCSMVLALLENGQVAEAELHWQAASEELKKTDLPQAQLSLQITKAYLCKAQNQPEQALILFQDALETAKENGALFEQERLGLELDFLSNDLERARKRMQWFEERGLNHSVNIAKRYFPDLALKTQPFALKTKPLVPDTKKPIGLRVLGNMQIRYENDLEKLKGSKRQELLALLLEAKLSGYPEVSRLELVDKLYPNEAELKATNKLKSMVFALRELLGSAALITTATGYALGNLYSDAEAFLTTGETSLWQGNYLQDISLENQASVAESLYLLLFEKAKTLLETKPLEVTRVSKFLLEFDPYGKDYLALCLKAYRLSNNHKSLNRLYADTREKFKELGESLPETWQMFLNPSKAI